MLLEAQQVGVRAGTIGTPCEEVDRATRAVIDEAGYGEYFIHRTGHGIGMEEHEDPYIVEGNALPLAPGHAYSVEPGIYVPGKWGMRLEDIVVATADGAGVAEQLRSHPHQRVISVVISRRSVPRPAVRSWSPAATSRTPSRRGSRCTWSSR